MKTPLLSALLLFTVLLNAQDTITRPKKTIEQRQKRFDIGGGVQVNSIRFMSVFIGPEFNFKANSKYGRIAGIVSLSYNFGKTFNALNSEVYYNYSNGYPKSAFNSDVRYNALKISLAMQVPFFNRTNKKGFSLSGLMGVSYYNGLGSGEYISFLDKPNAPVLPGNPFYIRPTQKFSFDNKNLGMLRFDIGISAAYTYQRYQFYTNACYVFLGGYTGDGQTVDSRTDSGGGFFNSGSFFSYGINFGIRYCLYQPWQAKPPKRFGKK